MTETDTAQCVFLSTPFQWGVNTDGWRQSPLPLLSLNQNGLVVLQVFLDALLVGKREGRPFGFILDELVMHQMFAYDLDLKT